MIWVIARREVSSMFLSPLAWVILGVINAVLGYLFLSKLDAFFTIQPKLIHLQNSPGVTDLVITPVMQMAAIIMLMVMPLITMNSIAEERRNRSLTLLISSPLSMLEIVLGKYLGLLLFIFILVGILMLMPLSLYLGTSLDGGKLFSIYIGMVLLLSAFAAIGLYLSSLTENPTIAAISSFGTLLMLWLIGWVGESLYGGGSGLSYLSILQHHQSMLEGLFDTSDIAYYLILIVGFLGLTLRQLDRGRLL